jgi:hypothetical protein
MSEGSGHRSWATNGYRNRPFRPRNMATELPRRLRRWIAAQPSARTTARLRWEMGRNNACGTATADSASGERVRTGADELTSQREFS